MAQIGPYNKRISVTEQQRIDAAKLSFEYRQHLGLTQGQLGEQLNVSQVYISWLENGYAAAPGWVVNQILDSCVIPSDTLAEGCVL
jgi:DNA-binding XRE family transcriptional regulator